MASDISLLLRPRLTGCITILPIVALMRPNARTAGCGSCRSTTKSSSFGDGSDFDERSLGEQLSNPNRCPGWIWFRYELILNFDERSQMTSKSDMVRSHVDNVFESKSRDSQIDQQKFESIAKLRRWISGNRQIRLRAGDSREEHELPSVQNWGKMPIARIVRQLRGRHCPLHGALRIIVGNTNFSLLSLASTSHRQPCGFRALTNSSIFGKCSRL